MTYSRRQVVLAVLSGALLTTCLFNPAGISAMLFVAGGVHNVYVFTLAGVYVLTFVLGMWLLRRAFARDAQAKRSSVVAAALLTIALLLPQWFYTVAPIAVGYLGMPRAITAH